MSDVQKVVVEVRPDASHRFVETSSGRNLDDIVLPMLKGRQVVLIIEVIEQS